METVIPIILSGGTGSRLWPLSRESFPKQFLNLTDEENFTLLQQTYKRIEDLENLSKPISNYYIIIATIITYKAQAFLLREL